MPLLLWWLAASVIAAAAGLVLVQFGGRHLRAIAFPLLFLVFALPIPLGLTERIHLELRYVATAGTAAIVPMFGVPLFVEGTTLNMARGSLQVADACSGFSTLYAAAAVACLTAWSAKTICAGAPLRSYWMSVTWRSACEFGS